MDVFVITVILPLVAGVILDKILGDPAGLPHPVVGFGRLIGFFEHRWNKGTGRKRKGIWTVLILVVGVYIVSWGLMHFCFSVNDWLGMAVASVLVFFCLAGKTLIDEVRMVFEALDISLDKGRYQVSRIVGRDTARLSGQEVRTAALETLAENLSDGVIAPLFWYLVLGVPGILTYKMINTLDSMIGYRNERYRDFGCFAAHLDDIANYIPARITAFLMVLVSGRPSLLSFVRKYGRKHASPNSGYPESALAGILDCRFGGPHDYFGETVYKPYIGENDRLLDTKDAMTAIRINRKAEGAMVICMVILYIGYALAVY
ncbi:adenosylcobinamide-phosphate synthase CbiB [Bacteroides ilei]|uniref:adenosylcobinamide-phosphate synthase CbiB n=1 Tax=Bacteroides ilei TaxID=1907658 RepID=UPI0009316881|nr:adenosylcobinamide-phosphate synthase CbiB [Bacteroides ilei]